jgi:hypothetical protein
LGGGVKGCFARILMSAEAPGSDDSHEKEGRRKTMENHVKTSIK